MRARYPDIAGLIVRVGVEIRYERYPYLARRFTVVCFDGRGCGGSGRPAEPSANSDVAFAADALAVTDAAGIGSAYDAHYWKTHHPQFPDRIRS